MVGWSSLGVNSFKLFLRPSALKKLDLKNVSKRFMSEDHGHHETMKIVPSRWQWNKFKDLIHYYTLIGLIPVTLLIFYTNVYIGPAQLAEIPEDYTPKHWEYYKHPITRWLARYMFTPPQQEYEKYMHLLYEQDEKRKLRALENKIKDKMQERADYQAYYYKQIDGKYIRIVRKDAEEISERIGIPLKPPN